MLHSYHIDYCELKAWMWCVGVDGVGILSLGRRCTKDMCIIIGVHLKSISTFILEKKIICIDAARFMFYYPYIYFHAVS